MHNDSRVLENFLSIISDRSRFLSERLRLLSFGAIKSRLRSYFLELTRDNDYGTFTVPHTHQELADMFGVTRPALSRAIRQLEDSGTIRRKGDAGMNCFNNFHILPTTQIPWYKRPPERIPGCLPKNQQIHPFPWICL